ncbi:MAG: WHG domain-containing protein [Gammaproteobacteria bacterium]|nr:WHG domain-containing protein [Gammaproteobacteria bacterium]
MARRHKHSLKEIREMVLDAAETIVIDKGYSALTVRRIAMDIGYTVGCLYMVFDNMADLLVHIKANTVDNLIEQLQQVPENDVPEHYIAELAKAYLQFANQNFNRWSMIFAHDDETPAWYRQKTRHIPRQIEAQLAKLAPHCSAQQHKQAALALCSGIHGICTLSLTGKQNADEMNQVENTISLLVESFIGGWVASLYFKNQS